MNDTFKPLCAEFQEMCKKYNVDYARLHMTFLDSDEELTQEVAFNENTWTSSATVSEAQAVLLDASVR